MLISLCRQKVLKKVSVTNSSWNHLYIIIVGGGGAIASFIIFRHVCNPAEQLLFNLKFNFFVKPYNREPDPKSLNFVNKRIVSTEQHIWIKMCVCMSQMSFFYKSKSKRFVFNGTLASVKKHLFSVLSSRSIFGLLQLIVYQLVQLYPIKREILIFKHLRWSYMILFLLLS